MNPLKNKFIPFILLIFICLALQWKYLNEFPSHIHAWAQSDRYALALGFTKNGFDFFHPQTFIQNHQFPGNFKVADHTAITAVDFPIHDYLVAVIMKITGSGAPCCFRLYSFIYSLIGLFFLYLLAARCTKNNWLAFVVILFAGTSPVYVYYQSGFLPTIPSLSNVFIACYFYVKYLSDKKFTHFALAIFFLTLASLSRTPFSIFLISLFLSELFFWKDNHGIRPKILKCIAYTISFASIAGYILYNRYLLKTYGSIFLNHPLPPQSFAESIALIKSSLTQWFFHYFSIYHYLTIIALTGWGLVSVKKANIPGFLKNPAVFPVLLSLVGCFCYSILMLKQFPAHDYYFLDTFFAPFILGMLLLIGVLKNTRNPLNKIIPGAIIGLSIGLLINAANYQEKRRITGYWDRTTATINNFQGAKTFLDATYIPITSKILVIDAYAPNIPFILMDRPGYAVMTTSKDNIHNALKWDFDYIVIQNCFLVSDVVSNYPALIRRITKTADNGKISLYKLLRQPQNITLLQFLGLDNKTPLVNAQITFDTIAPPGWQMPEICSTIAFSGEHAGFTNKKEEFGITYKTKSNPWKKNKSGLVMVQSRIFIQEPLNDCFIVVSINDHGENVYYNALNIKDTHIKPNTWHDVQLLYQIPAIDSSNVEFGVYLWNNGRNNIWYDDFQLRVY
jgi:hypothetical protein